MKSIGDDLISVIVLSYESRSVISRTLHSVFAQDYSRIELIVADDGSKDFSREYVEELCSCSSSENVERCEIIAALENEGTVRNLWRALDVMQGDYFVVLGAGDSFVDKGSLTAYMTGFYLRAWKPLLVTGLAEMWSEDMNRCMRVIPEGTSRRALQSEDSGALLNVLAYDCAVPIVATCFHKDFIGRVGAFDCAYRYYEDYPTFIRMAVKGITPAYLDRAMVRHAAGGVANGDGSPKIALGLFEDRSRMWQVELGPHRELLSAESIKRNEERRKREKAILRKATGSNVGQKSGGSFVSRGLGRFLRRGGAHRVMQSYRFMVLSLLLCVAYACLSTAFPIVTCGLFLLFAANLLAFLWFSGLSGVRLVKRLAGRGREAHK